VRSRRMVLGMFTMVVLFALVWGCLLRTSKWHRGMSKHALSEASVGEHVQKSAGLRHPSAEPLISRRAHDRRSPTDVPAPPVVDGSARVASHKAELSSGRTYPAELSAGHREGPGSPRVAATPDTEPRAGPPRIVFDSATFDFGTLYQMEGISHDFTFRNAGGGVLEIADVDPLCGCTAAIVSERWLEPGERGAIRVTFDAGLMHGHVSKKLYVRSNDTANPRVALIVSGTVKAEVMVEPRGVYIGEVSIGETVERSITITATELRSFSIVEVTADNDLVHPSDPVSLPGVGGGYRIKVRFGPSNKAGQVNCRLTVRTDLPHSRELPVPVYGKVVEAAQHRSSRPTKPPP